MSATVPPGWYPDPAQPGGQRYWDGYQWTNVSAPAAAAVAPPAPPGYTPPPSYLGPASPRAQWGSGVAVTSLIFGIVAIMFAVLGLLLPLMAFMGMMCGAVALVMGLVARKTLTPSGMATGAIVTGIIGVLLSIGILALGILIAVSSTGS